MILERLADFHRATHRHFRIIPKNERTTVAGRQTQQFAFSLRSAELLGATANFPQFLQVLGLLVNEQLGIADDVDKKNVPDFELHIGSGQHAISLPRSSESDEIGGLKSG